MRTPLVCLDAGHGGPDSGASRPPYVEKSLSLAVVRQIDRFLDQYQTATVLTRDHDVFIPLAERCRIANVKKCDVFVSVHLNADPDPDLVGMREATGYEVWYGSGSVKGESLAKELLKGLSSCLPQSRGTRSTTHLYVLKHTKMPACLVELGFVDSTHDATALADPKMQERLGLALAQSILRWWDAQQGT